MITKENKNGSSVFHVSCQNSNESRLLTESQAAATEALMKQELEVIQAKKAEATRELEVIERRRIELDQWIRDLTTTERTLARLLDVDLPEPSGSIEPTATKRRKPANTPSIYDMAVTIIRDRAEEWVEAQEILAGVRRRWWPGATNVDVSPTLWRLATKDGRLRKEGTRYALPINGSDTADSAATKN